MRIPLIIYLLAAVAGAVAGAEPTKLQNGAPAYRPPLMAVARTPYTIPRLTSKAIDIQTDLGCQAGFSGFVDAAVGAVGYPGYRNFSNLEIAYDTEKLCLLVCVPYPLGRKNRAAASGPSDALAGDDVYEVLIDPRDGQGRSKGPVYRVVGNANGACRIDLDLPQIGQPHQPWPAAVKCGGMMWDPMGSWMAAMQIPFRDLGGPPQDGDVWGVQAAIRYVDPKITAVLSPSDDFAATGRFARVRFDAQRRANYRCHWLCADDIRNGTFCLGGIFSNGGNEPAWFDGSVSLFQGDRLLGSGKFSHAAKPLSRYDGDMQPCRLPSQPATSSQRDTVAHIVVTDRRAKCVVYDQYVPYWRPAPGERDWLKRHFAKEFVFQVGPYPSRGAIDYAIDCQTLMEALPAAERVVVTATLSGKEAARHERALPKDGKLTGTLSVGKMGDGAVCEIVAAISDRSGKALSTKRESFVRKVMPFEKTPPAGIEDIVPAPFTRQLVEGNSISCVGRTYTHGTSGLLEGINAGGKEILAAPVTLRIESRTGRCVGMASALPAAARCSLKSVGQARRPTNRCSRSAARKWPSAATLTTTASTVSPSALPRGPISGRIGGRQSLLPGSAAPRQLCHAHRGSRGMDVERLAEMHGLSRFRPRPSLGLEAIPLRRPPAQRQHAAVLLGRRR